jgi:FkbM family methyltransferase
MRSATIVLQNQDAKDPVASVFHRIGNKAYKYAFPVYRYAYRIFKAYADRAERRLLQKILLTGAVVVDAGANIGVYSEFLSRCVGPNGVVHSFEPCPANFMRLRCATRKLPNVCPYPAAVGERSGETMLYVSDKLNVDHRSYATEGNARRALQVGMVALDDHFKPGERVDLLKLDVQGYELHALQGAKRVVNENREIKLLLEFWPYGLKQAGVNWTELIEMLEGFAMDIMFVRADGLMHFDAHDIRTDANWYVNLFASRSAAEAATAGSTATSVSKCSYPVTRAPADPRTSLQH